MKQTVNLEALNSLKCFNKLSYQAGPQFQSYMWYEQS